MSKNQNTLPPNFSNELMQINELMIKINNTYMLSLNELVAARKQTEDEQKEDYDK